MAVALGPGRVAQLDDRALDRPGLADVRPHDGLDEPGAFAATSAASTSWTAVVVLPPSAASIAARIDVEGNDSARWMKSWSKASPWIPSNRRAAVLIRVM